MFTISCNASAKFVLVGINTSAPHMIGSPVYTIHSAFNTSEHGSGVGHPIGDGHGAGVVSIVSRHPQFAVVHLQVLHVDGAVIVAIIYYFTLCILILTTSPLIDV